MFGTSHFCLLVYGLFLGLRFMVRSFGLGVVRGRAGYGVKSVGVKVWDRTG